MRDLYKTMDSSRRRFRPKKRSSILVAVSLACCSAFIGCGELAAAFSPTIRPSTRLPLRIIQEECTRNRRLLPEPSNRPFPLSARQWEGDDIRLIPKIRRRLSYYSNAFTPSKTVLIFLNIVFFLYQVINSVSYLRRKHPAYWPSEALHMIYDVLIGTSIVGPFTADFVHQGTYSRWQPHRYLTAGFLHGSFIHLLFNMHALRQAPNWLETGLGWPLFLTTFIVGIISGNVWHSLSTLTNSSVLGASGGICALYGLMLVSLTKMGNTQMGTRVLKNMGFLLLFGVVLENVSNATHIGGFLGGVVMGILCCPSYHKSYAMSRKNSLEVDVADREYRLAMGFGKVPSRRGLVPLSLLWAIAVVALVSDPLYRRIPLQIYRGLVQPGIHSNMRFSPVPSTPL